MNTQIADSGHARAWIEISRGALAANAAFLKSRLPEHCRLMPAVKAVLPLMSDYGMIVCEHPPEVAVEPSVGGFSVYKTYCYGKALVTVYR